MQETRVSLQSPTRQKEIISKMFNKVELSISSYDTAWVAMVPSRISPGSPYFPECLKWLLENQHPDGSWGLPHHHPLLVKDTLLSTLASILALKKWDVGEELVNKGLHFITSNIAFSTDEKQHNPIGFNILFPGMLKSAQVMGIDFDSSQEVLNDMLEKSGLELNRAPQSEYEGIKLYMAYVAEGWANSQDWKEIMKYQRKNGSLFNSPSTTAAASVITEDVNCLNYLRSLLNVYGNAVPAAYPLDIYTQLCLVYDLESLGISRHFEKEIRTVLDTTYRCWLINAEEIFLDVATCAKAFRILRAHGYNVSSDALTRFSEEGFMNTLGGYLKDAGAVLELYRASHFGFSDEPFLKDQNIWSGRFLEKELSNSSMHADRLYEYISKEVDVELRYPYYANLQRLENRRKAQLYDVDNLRILKSSYRPTNADNKVILQFAVEDFNLCQSVQQRELKQLEGWVKENRLDKLAFARQKQAYCYFSAAATLFPPELSDARMSWAKNSVLTTVVDDFYDVGGSKEELLNLIELVERWDEASSGDIFSEQVEIIFSALRSTANKLGEKAIKQQGRNIANHIAKIWLTMIRSMMKEAEWSETRAVPTFEEYYSNAYNSFALGPILLTALYFVGPYLSDELVGSLEYHNLFRLVSICGRNLNDLQGYKRESNEGKLNGIHLLMLQDPGVATEEEAARILRIVVDSNRKELMKLVLLTEGSVVPMACKELFWNMCKVLHLFYASNDGFTSAEQMVNDVKAVMFEPLSMPAEQEESSE